MKTLDQLLAEAAAQQNHVVTLRVVNPTERELRRLRQQVQTINSNKAPGIGRARLHEMSTPVGDPVEDTPGPQGALPE